MTTSRRFESIGTILSRPVAAASLPAHGDAEPDTTLLRAVPGGSTAAGAQPPTPDASDGQEPHSEAGQRLEHQAQPRRTSPAVKASAASTGGPRRIVFRLDPDLHARLSARATTTGVSYGEVVLDAVEDAHRRGVLDDLLQRPDVPSTGMFPRLRSRSSAKATIPVEVRLDGRAVDRLDTLAAERHAASRTHLMTVAIAAFLGHSDGAGTN